MASPSRFVDIDSDEKFIEEQENENTKKKTEQNIYLLKQFLALKEETRPVENIPPLELNSFISEFIITVRRKDNEEYEPDSLRAMIASFERYLRKKTTASALLTTRNLRRRAALKPKQKDLKN